MNKALEYFEDMVEANQLDYNDEKPKCDLIRSCILKSQENARSDEILQKYYQEGITLDSVRALKQENDKYKRVLNIIKEKNVDINSLKQALSVKQYNDFISFKINYMDYMKLTQEEFDLLKRCYK